MKMHPLLAIIVPVYKVEKYLDKCLDSLINQTYKNLEIICVNDGSPDKCNLILHKYKLLDNRIVVITTDNKGLSAARNTGLKYIHEQQSCTDKEYRYVTFVDSDDFVDLNTYESAMSHFNDSIDLVCFGYRRIEENSVQQNNFQNCTPNWRGFIGECDVTDFIIETTCPMVWCKIYRLDIIYNNKIYFPEGLKYEDNYFTKLYMLFCAKVYIDAQPFYNYLIRSDSIMGLTKKHSVGNVQQSMQIIDSVLSYLKEHNIFIKYNNFFWLFAFNSLRETILISANPDEELYIYNKAKIYIRDEVMVRDCCFYRRYIRLIFNNQLKPISYNLFNNTLSVTKSPMEDIYCMLGFPVLKIAYYSTGRTYYFFKCVKIKKAD